MEQHFAVYAAGVDGIVHAVQTPQQGGFAAAGRADQGGDLPRRDLQSDAFQRLEVTVI